MLVVVGATLELVMAAGVAGAVDLRSVEAVVIVGAAVGAAEAAGDALDQRLLVDDEFDDIVELAAALAKQDF